MARTIDRQLSRVRTRLVLSSLLTLLAWCWLAAVGLAAAWVVAQPFVLRDGAPAGLAWMVTGGLLALATLVAITLAVRRAPSAVSAALALDARFGLQERVTTSMTLGDAEANSPAGQALLADAERRVAGVKVRDRFPILFPRLPAACLPVALAALALLGLFWHPKVGAGGGGGEDEVVVGAGAKEEVADQMKKLAEKPKGKKADEKTDAADLERINAEIENFTRKPHETREEIRDRIKDATALEEQIRREQKEQAERVDAFREAMKQAERLGRKNREKENGPANKAADALARGDMAAMKDELQRLSREVKKEEEKERLKRKKRDPDASDDEKKDAEDRLKELERENNMTEKEKEQLAKQLEQMEDDLKRLSRKKEEKEKELRDMADKGEIEQSELERELDQLAKNEEQLEQDKKDLEELSKELGECKECMKEGKTGEAAKKLAKAAQKAGQCEKGGNGDQLQKKLAQVQQVRRSLSRSLSGQAGVGSGRRPEAKDDNTGHKDALVPGELDQGKMQVVGQGPMGGFNGPRKPGDMKAEIKQAAQEEAGAIDRQRLPPSARKMARGYFEKVREAEKEKK